MINLSQLNSLIRNIVFFIIFLLSFNSLNAAEDIWKSSEDKAEQKLESNQEPKKSKSNSILIKNTNADEIVINEEKIEDFNQTLIGIFDPEENNLSLNMWSQTDGDDIKKVLDRINKLKLTKLSENLLFEVLFTNAYAPRKNLNSEEFLKIKIDWLIKNERIQDLELLLKKNSGLIKDPRAVKLLVNEYLSSSDIDSACEKTEFLAKDIQNEYIDKFIIYCLIKNERKEEAQLLFDLMTERGFKDKFFENKFYYLLGVTNETNQKVSDKNLLNFYLSYITSKDFKYDPIQNTNKYIWRYMSAANLMKTKDFENQDVITTYEKAASENSFRNNELFKIYLQMSFTFNQLSNSIDIYKSLPNYKARALIYQSMLLAVDPERKIYLAFILKELFIKDSIFNVYQEELSNILKKIDPQAIPEQYAEIVNQNIDSNFTDIKKIKFDNSILHKSKIIRHFLEDYEKTSRTEKDFKSVYKKVKKNKKYFVSIMDIIVLESLAADGIKLPNDLDYSSASFQLNVPKNLDELVKKEQQGMVILKIIEIIGEDKIQVLDPETIYFLTKILNELNLKKIRNDILSKALPSEV